MTKDELLEALKDVPGKAEIYVESDNGQYPEMSGGVFYCDSHRGKLPYYGEDLDWYNEEASNMKKVKAVLIR